MAKRRDWIFRGLLACCTLVLSASLLLFTQYFLQSSEPLQGLRIVELSNVSWLQELDALVLGLTFVLLAFFLYVVARRRALGNKHLRPSAGCPSCQELRLVRVARYPHDRILGYSLIPMGRFVCAGCRWEGRRIIFRSYPGSRSLTPLMSSEMLKSHEVVNAGIEKEPTIKPDIITRDSPGKLDPNATVGSGGTGLEKQKESLPASDAAGRDRVNALAAEKGYKLTDKWSNHAITVHGRDSSHGAEPGEVVGTLHVQLWQSPGDESSLHAWLDHSTTTVTIYKRAKEAEKAKK